MGHEGVRPPREWRLVDAGDRFVVVRGAPLACRLRAARESRGSWLGDQPGTLLARQTGLTSGTQSSAPAAHFAHLALGSVPSLTDAEELSDLPDLVAASGEAVRIARQLDLPEVALDVSTIWDELAYSPDAVRMASSQMRSLTSELHELERLNAAVIARAEEPVRQRRTLGRREAEEDVANKLVSARNAIRREKVLRQALLDEPER